MSSARFLTGATLVALLVLVVLPALPPQGPGVSAQPAQRRAANVAALTSHTAFYHLRPVVVVGTLTRLPNGSLRVSDAPASPGARPAVPGPSIQVVFTGTTPDGAAEIRGDFWDLGRMNSDDPRFSTYDLRAMFGIDPEKTWPRPGEVTAIIASDISAATPPRSTSVRSMVLFPARYLDQKVTVTGQFAGRNLLGDLPEAPGQSSFDFVVRSADAAIWVTNLRPRGRDFELSLDTRIDTGRWVQVTGTLRQGRGLLWIDAKDTRIALTDAPTEIPIDEPIRVAAAPPPEVIFSTPLQGEGDVIQTTTVRIQFSRDLDPSTLKDHVKVRYLDEEARNLGEPDTPIAVFTYQYTAAPRVLEIKFSEPLVRYRTIKVDLLEGILATDKQPLQPWTLSFQTAGAI